MPRHSTLGIGTEQPCLETHSCDNIDAPFYAIIAKKRGAD